MQQAIDAIGLPPGYHAVFGGDVQNLEETKGYVLEALLLAVVFIYLILASLFGSFLQPLAIMLALPLSFIGVALALLAHEGQHERDDDDRHHHAHGARDEERHSARRLHQPAARRTGRTRADALLSAARIRLRPIIMTTVAMIFGMIPLALAIGEGAEQRAPMARAVIGGLITSTLLTLFVVPVVYTLLDDLAAIVMKRSRSHVPSRSWRSAAGSGSRRLIAGGNSRTRFRSSGEFPRADAGHCKQSGFIERNGSSRTD